MKRSTRIILIVAAGIFFVGATLCLIALVSVDFDVRKLNTQEVPLRRVRTVHVDNVENITVIDDFNGAPKVMASPDELLHIIYFTDRFTGYEIVQDESGTVVRRIDHGRRWYEWIGMRYSVFDTRVRLMLPEGYTGTVLSR